MMSSKKQFCTFFLSDLLFGIEVTLVQEVIRFQPMSKVPLAPPMIHGLINLRGQIVTAIDLRRCLDLPTRHADTLPMNVVVRGSEGSVSLLVDAIGDVIDVDESTFEAAPSTMLPPQRDVIDAVCKLPGSLLLILDPERAIMSACADTKRPARRNAGQMGHAYLGER